MSPLYERIAILLVDAFFFMRFRSCVASRFVTVGVKPSIPKPTQRRGIPTGSSFQDRSLSGRCYFADGLQERMNRPRRGIRTDDSALRKTHRASILALAPTCCALLSAHARLPWATPAAAEFRAPGVCHQWRKAMSHQRSRGECDSG